MIQMKEIPVKEKEPAQKEAELKDIYEKTFQMVARFISKMGGNFEEAKDIFQDALVIYMEVISGNHDKIKTSERAYLLGITKHLWIRKHEASRAFVSMDQFEVSISVPVDFYPTLDNNRILRFLEMAGKKCMDLLRAFYYQKIPVKKLAKDLGYSNEHSASVQKYKCLEKVRHFVKKKSLSYEDFIEEYPFN